MKNESRKERLGEGAEKGRREMPEKEDGKEGGNDF